MKHRSGSKSGRAWKGMKWPTGFWYLFHSLRIFPFVSTFAKNGNGRGKILNRSEEHTSELQSRLHLVCRLLLEKKKKYPILSLTRIRLSTTLPALTRLLSRPLTPTSTTSLPSRRTTSCHHATHSTCLLSTERLP